MLQLKALLQTFILLFSGGRNIYYNPNFIRGEKVIFWSFKVSERRGKTKAPEFLDSNPSSLCRLCCH